ncbi:integral nuclear inner membrane protein Bqt4 [Schizosaccharomyces pombe]|uniref:Bouquet formation protein 4 n=1 Tax=Schizosaccharomyces pombe (strain 972 / ATCC 24843) TaxID=284812 RepID=BQT4_SCHPO|nr:bouquet formation protein Bqt4 [Schizosaccharomyces pombe]O60158.2 RecName: Full=Bouquet formation protein 4 [Schizosaccharomyces pombe 972h-]CAB43057.1 bouquet formation protein Bqt4 [Schizosaccharomyces pombe]|eukprot:NP_596166.1 bouquet formation protein Bqt4 [Schizosaccharomyces pombe]
MTENEKSRSLPAERNPLYKDDTLDHTPLIPKCRAQVIEFPDGPATFVRLKCTNPESKVPHFLMRMAKDSSISATSMFRSAFPKATQEEEDLEMRWIRDNLNPIEDKRVAGLWVPPADALALAKDYSMTPFINALLEASSTPSTYATPSRPTAQKSETSEGEPESSTSATTTSVARRTRQRLAEHLENSKKTILQHDNKEEDKEIHSEENETKDEIKSEKKEPEIKKQEGGSSTEKVGQPSSSDDKAKGSTSKDQPSEEEEKTSDIQDRKIKTPIKPSLLGKIRSSVNKGMTDVASQVNRGMTDVASQVNKGVNGVASQVNKGMNGVANQVNKGVTGVASQVRKPVGKLEKKFENLEKSIGDTLKSSIRSSPKSKKRSREDFEENEDYNAMVPVKRSRITKLESEVYYEKRKVRALGGIAIGLGVGAILPFLF